MLFEPIIIDRFLPESQFNLLNEGVMNSNTGEEPFLWYYNDRTLPTPESLRNFDSPHFSHYTIHGGKIISPHHRFSSIIIASAIKKINFHVTRPISARFNLTTKDTKSEVQLPHIDIDRDNKNCISLLFYLNTNNGGTVLYNESYTTSEKISGCNFKTVKDPSEVTEKIVVDSKANRLVVFNSNRFHSAKTTSDKNRKVIFNGVLEGYFK